MIFRIKPLLIVAVWMGLTVSAMAQTYPLENAPTMTYWVPSHANWDNRYKNFAETPFARELAKRTGVNLSYTTPPSRQAAQTLNLMIASGDLADMMEYPFLDLPGGPDKLINDGYIVRLNDAIAKWAPNLSAFLKSRPDIDKMIRTKDGDYYGFPFIRNDPELLVFQGPIVRKDWLDELGLKLPETIDDWTVMLRAFKEKKGATAPFCLTTASFGDWKNSAFFGAFGALKDWYVENGKVKFGPAEAQYKDGVNQFAVWYKDGLLDPNIAMTDSKTRDALFDAGKTGSTVGLAGGGLGYLSNLMAGKDPNAKLVGAPYPVLKRGDRPKFGQLDMPFTKVAVAISSKTKNLEAAVRFLDYGYSPDGALFYNFGTPGVSYTMVDGKPTYTDYIMKNPKLSLSEAMAEHVRASANGPFLQDVRYLHQYMSLPAQMEAIRVWGNTDQGKYQMPRLTADDSEAKELAKILSEVNTYVAESFTKFVIGVEPIANFDAYFATLKKLNIDRAIAIYQKSYDAYLKR